MALLNAFVTVLGILVWPTAIVYISHLIFTYIDAILKLRQPLDDLRYQELAEELKRLRSDVNSFKIQNGFERELE